MCENDANRLLWRSDFDTFFFCAPHFRELEDLVPYGGDAYMAVLTHTASAENLVNKFLFGTRPTIAQCFIQIFPQLLGSSSQTDSIRHVSSSNKISGGRPN